MKMLKIGGLVAALAAAVGVGAAFAPVAHGQGASTRARVAPRALEMLGGRGSEIGVSIRDLEDADVKGGKTARGVFVDEVNEDSPAAAAGLKKGDVVVEFDGEAVRSARQFTRLISETPAGRKVPAAVLRDGQRITVSVEPRASDGFRVFGLPNVRVFDDIAGDFHWPVPPAPPAPPSAPAPPAVPGFENFVWRAGNTLGVEVSDVSPQLAEYFGAKDGVLVTAVTERSAAAKAGVKAGDVITSINGATVDSASELRRRTQRLEAGADFTIDVTRDKKNVTLKGKMDEQRNRRPFRAIV